MTMAIMKYKMMIKRKINLPKDVNPLLFGFGDDATSSDISNTFDTIKPLSYQGCDIT